jgi:quercetin dioxygenase-like cupin family protein
MTEQVIDDPVLRQRYIFRRATDANGEEVAQVEFWVEPGGGVIPHIHPTFEERFEVLEGDEVTFWADGEPHPTKPGGKVVVPAGVKHTYRNTGATEAHVMCDASPPHPDLEGFLTDAAALARAGKFNKYGLPTKLSGVLPLSLMAYHYRESTLILRPPVPVQKLLVYPLGRLAERRGYRAGNLVPG